MHSSGTETIVLALLPKGEISLKIASAEATAAASTQKKGRVQQSTARARNGSKDDERAAQCTKVHFCIISFIGNLVPVSNFCLYLPLLCFRFIEASICCRLGIMK